MWAYEKNDKRNMSAAIKEYVNDTLICPGTPCFVTGNRSFLPSHDMFDAIGKEDSASLLLIFFIDQLSIKSYRSYAFNMTRTNIE